MGDPAEENDPPPESPGFLTNEIHSVNRKSEKKRLRQPTAAKSLYGSTTYLAGSGAAELLENQ